MSPSKRFYEIDLLRFLAAFSVVLFHYTFRGAAAGGLTELSYPWLAPVTKYGYLGVDLFFLISGFVILMTASSGSNRQFLISRIVRLYPAFWVCCTASWIVSHISANGRHVATPVEYAANMTMLNGLTSIPFIDNVYWSLLVEMKFYFLVFIVLLFNQIHRAKWLLGGWLVAYAIVTFWPIKFVTFFLIPEFAPYFIAGAMFFLISREGLDFYKGVILAASYALIVHGSTSGLVAQGERYHTHYDPIVVASAEAIMFVVFFLVSTHRTEKLATKKFMVLGALTYPLYLIHQNIGFALFNRFYPGMNVHVVLWSVVALMLTAAYAVTRIERVTARPLKQILTRLLM